MQHLKKLWYHEIIKEKYLLIASRFKKFRMRVKKEEKQFKN